MLASLLSSGTLVPLLGAGLFCALRCLTSWVAGLRVLILVTIFGGIFFIHLGSGAALVLFRDLFVVLPLYAAFLATPAGAKAILNLPADLALMLIITISYIALSTLNTTALSWLQVVIGLKIWLFYLPFLVIGLALAARPAAMTSVLRTLLFWGMIACAIGLLQSFLVRLVGYQTTMTFFFGSKAADVTQHFAWFQDAGGIFRIPGTFTFATQYSNFLYLFLTVATIEANADPDASCRRFAQIAMFVAGFALLLSGSRATGLTVSAFFALYFMFGLLRTRALTLAPVAGIAGWAALQWLGFHPEALFTTGGRLVEFYSRTFVVQEFTDALRYGAFGAGIGSSTNAARYAVGTIPGGGGILPYESYYAKIAAELGIIGLTIMCGLFIVIWYRVISFAARLRFNSPVNSIVAPWAIYIMYNSVTFVRGTPLDQDPVNMFYWLALGIVLGVSRDAIARRNPMISPHAWHDRNAFSGVLPKDAASPVPAPVNGAPLPSEQ